MKKYTLRQAENKLRKTHEQIMRIKGRTNPASWLYLRIFRNNDLLNHCAKLAHKDQ